MDGPAQARSRGLKIIYPGHVYYLRRTLRNKFVERTKNSVRYRCIYGFSLRTLRVYTPLHGTVGNETTRAHENRRM